MAKKEVRIRSKSVKPLTSWWPRFWAWAVDAIVLTAILVLLFPLKGDFTWEMEAGQQFASGLIVFVYWTLTDSDGRQSIGKKALGLKLVKKDGKSADVKDAAVSAFGKAFLLPLDLLIGVLARPGKKQRLFNILSDTVVVKLE